MKKITLIIIGALMLLCTPQLFAGFTEFSRIPESGYKSQMDKAWERGRDRELIQSTIPYSVDSVMILTLENNKTLYTRIMPCDINSYSSDFGKFNYGEKIKVGYVYDGIKAARLVKIGAKTYMVLMTDFDNGKALLFDILVYNLKTKKWEPSAMRTYTSKNGYTSAVSHKHFQAFAFNGRIVLCISQNNKFAYTDTSPVTSVDDDDEIDKLKFKTIERQVAINMGYEPREVQAVASDTRAWDIVPYSWNGNMGCALVDMSLVKDSRDMINEGRHNFNIIASRFLLAYDGLKVEFRADDPVKYETYFDFDENLPLPKGKMEGLTVVPGSIAGFDSKSEFLPLQLFFSSSERKVKGETFNIELNPAGRYYRLGEEDPNIRITDIPYGTIGACSFLKLNPLKINGKTCYQQYIALVRGGAKNSRAYADWFSAATVKSNLMVMKENTVKTSIDKATFRDVMTLLGVIEGPPPSPYSDTPAWANNKGFNVSFGYSNSQKEAIKSESNYHFDASVGAGGGVKDVYDLEAMLGYAYDNYASKNNSIEHTYSLSLAANSTYEYGKGLVIYSAPTIRAISGAICSPTNIDYEYNVALVPTLRVTGTEYVTEQFDLDKLGEKFAIKDAKYLNSWKNIRFNQTGTMYSKNMEMPSYLDVTHGVKFEETIVASTTHAVTESLKLKLFAFRLNQNFSAKFTNSTTTTKGQNFTISIKTGDSKGWRNSNDTKYIRKYFTECNIFNPASANDVVGKEYLNALKSVYMSGTTIPIVREGDNPFIITWTTNSIEESNTYNSTAPGNPGSSGIGEAEKGEITPSKAYIRDSNMVVEAEATSQVTIFTMQGIMIKNLYMDSNKIETELPNSGVYIVKIQAPDGTVKTEKLIK